jgi:hypothetical protein
VRGSSQCRYIYIPYKNMGHARHIVKEMEHIFRIARGSRSFILDA